MSLLLVIVATALLSSVLTGALLTLLWRRMLLPELERRLDERLARARAEFELTVEKGARKGFADALASTLPSREVLQDTTITVARSGIDLLSESLNTLLGAKRGRRASDRDPGGSGGASR